MCFHEEDFDLTPRPRWFTRLITLWLLFLVAVVLGALLLAVASVWGAPAPLAKASAPAVGVRTLAMRDWAGEWSLLWGSIDYDMTLTLDGRYRCVPSSGRSGAVWAGWWGCAEKSPRLVVSEAYLDDDVKRPEDCPFSKLAAWELTVERGADGLFDRTALSGKATYCDGNVSVQMKRKAPGR